MPSDRCVYCCREPKELNAALYDLKPSQEHYIRDLLFVGPEEKLTTDSVVDLLEDLYCGPIAVEFMHLQVNKKVILFALYHIAHSL